MQIKNTILHFCLLKRDFSCILVPGRKLAHNKIERKGKREDRGRKERGCNYIMLVRLC